jgi:hypothetical protein
MDSELGAATLEQDPADVLVALAALLDRYAIRARDWYLSDKRSKRRYSRLFRALAIAFSVAGGIAPVIATHDRINLTWGYVSLALAAGCFAADNLFGLSAAWMRNMASAQRLDRLRFEFHLAWTSGARDAIHADIDNMLQLLAGYAREVFSIVEGETIEWRIHFEGSLRELKHMVDKDRNSRSVEFADKSLSEGLEPA